MRGKLLSVGKSSNINRITPAHAGKTPVISSAVRLLSDHPRTCGENFGHLSRDRLILGSPPHMRGKPFLHQSIRLFQRITPAHAGKTQIHREWHGAEADHPRTCGENLRRVALGVAYGGSPPHMRGKLAACRAWCGVWRITPAHAGKTVGVGVCEISEADHPRTCGENSYISIKFSCTSGSPPHMRGKHFGNVILPRLILIRFVNFL